MALIRLVALTMAFALVNTPSLAHAEPAGPAYVIEPSGPPNAVPMQPPGAPSTEVGVGVPPPSDVGVPYDAEAPDEADGDVPVPADAPLAVGTEPAPPVTSYPDDDPRALQDFMPRLDPYGTWVDDASYGLIWVPDRAIVGDGFSPYVSGGHWALDTVGNWVWVSDYAFGGVVFHYGRWAWTSRGWVWVPGYRYAPAWVSWRVPSNGYAYYGWAPVPPSFVWMNGAAVNLATTGSLLWVFCSSAFLFSPSPSSYVVHSPGDANVLAQNTRRYVAASPKVGAPSPPAVRTTHYAWPVPKMFNAHVAVRPVMAGGVGVPPAFRAAPTVRRAAPPVRSAAPFTVRAAYGRAH